MSDRGFLSDIMQRVAGAGRSRKTQEGETDLIAECRSLLEERSEAAGLVQAQHILDDLTRLELNAKRDFFLRIAREFGADDTALQTAIDTWRQGDVRAARAIHFAAEPRSQELIRALNRVPGATARLVALRADLLGFLREAPELKGLDDDFRHLFGSWFNRGFLEIRRIDWSTPAAILEKIIAYEAVHEFTGWDDLRQRVADPDRRLFAFFHPAMPTEPLIFVQVALTTEIPGAIAPILGKNRRHIDAGAAKVAVFYSISNCQKGLRGISFGNFLIKQVVSELQRDLPDLQTFVTLSPVPGLCNWAARTAQDAAAPLTDTERALIAGLPDGARPDPRDAARLAARYLTKATRLNGAAMDPVAHFHLGNGAVLHRVHAEADLGARGLKNSWGVMVNYLYDGARIEKNHQAYTTGRGIAVSPDVKALAEH